MDDFLDIEKQEARLKILLEDFPEADKKLIYQALDLARRKHSGQERDEGSPYIVHCIRVACCLIEESGIKKPEAICAALLHDAIEDTDLRVNEVIDRFGEKTGEIVRSLTRKKEGETEKTKYQRKYQHSLKIMKMNKDTRAIKACDYLDNIRSWPRIPEGHPSREKFPRWFKEAKTMYLPLAKSISPEMAEKMKKALFKAKSKRGEKV